MKKLFKKIVYKIIEKLYPELKIIRNNYYLNPFCKNNIDFESDVMIYPPYRLNEVKVGAYTYVAENSKISIAEIGRFCSIGPNFFCGYGIHPLNGISTHPMFYSTLKQNGYTLTKKNKIQERKKIKIGNDVFIGANVTVLDGVTIGDGAVIGAGSIVSKNIPEYAIAVGNPIKVIRYRFDEITIQKLLEKKWWDFKSADLQSVEELFFEVEKFIKN
jgi:virginiamycin A acetyltransferase